MQKIHSFTTVTHLSRFTETTYKISHDSNIKCVSHFTISAVLPGGLGVGMGHPSLLGPVSSVSQPPRLAWFLFFTLPLVFGTLMHFEFVHFCSLARVLPISLVTKIVCFPSVNLAATQIR